MAQKSRVSPRCSIETDLARNKELPRYRRLALSELQQVLLNLLNNAVDAIRQARGATVNGEHRTWRTSAVIDRAWRTPAIGIPEANLARIFDPFFTTKPVGQGDRPGSVHLLRHHREKLGGDIEVTQRGGQGNHFHGEAAHDRPQYGGPGFRSSGPA